MYSDLTPDQTYLLAYIIIGTIVLGLGFLMYLAYLMRLYIAAYDQRTRDMKAHNDRMTDIVGEGVYLLRHLPMMTTETPPAPEPAANLSVIKNRTSHKKSAS